MFPERSKKPPERSLGEAPPAAAALTITVKANHPEVTDKVAVAVPGVPPDEVETAAATPVVKSEVGRVATNWLERLLMFGVLFPVPSQKATRKIKSPAEAESASGKVMVVPEPSAATASTTGVEISTPLMAIIMPVF
jgi:hypothetical protein